MGPPPSSAPGIKDYPGVSNWLAGGFRFVVGADNIDRAIRATIVTAGFHPAGENFRKSLGRKDRYMSEGRLSGVILVVGAAACFGTNVVFARIAYAAGSDPLTYLFFRFGIASLAMAAIMHISGKPYPHRRLAGKLALLGGMGMAVATLCFYVALVFASASLVAVLTYTYPALVALWAVLFFKKRLVAATLWALVITVAGMVLTVGFGWQGQALGIFLSLATAAIFSVYLTLVGDAIREAGIIASSAVMIYTATIGYGLVMVVWGIHLPVTTTGWLAIVVSAFLSTSIGWLAFSTGLKRLDSPTVAMLATFEVVVAMVCSVLFLGEQVSLLKCLGAAMILSATGMLARNEMQPAAVA